MPSSTSSSDRPGSGGQAGDSLRPVIGLGLFLLVSLLLVVALVCLRPDRVNPVNDSSYFRMKLAWRDVADVVVLGNSQVYRGVDPAAFAETCPGASTLNFGFAGALMRGGYIDASLPVLRAEGPRLLLVGISPLQFKSETMDDGFTETLRHEAQFRLPWRFEAMLQPLLARLRPLEKPIPFERRVHWQYRPDGFVPSDAPMMPLDDRSLRKYAQAYETHPFSEPMYQAMLVRLQQLQAAGYRVAVFLTHSSPDFEGIDARMSGLDAARLQRDLRRHGLDFLSLPAEGLRSYDGVHLDMRSAEEFSRRLGRAVNDRLGTTVCAGSGSAGP